MFLFMILPDFDKFYIPTTAVVVSNLRGKGILNPSKLTHRMECQKAAIMHAVFSNSYSCMKIIVFWF